MKFNNLTSQFLLGIFVLIWFLFVPQSILAIDLFDFNNGNSYQIFSEIESKKIIGLFPTKIFGYFTRLKSSGYYNPVELTAVSLLKEVIRIDMTNYLLKDLPVDVSFKIMSQVIEIFRIIGSEDISAIVDRFEKETVKAAVNYAKDYLFKNKIKVSFGAMEMEYKAGTVNVSSPLQYIITYKPIDNNKGRLIARLYSINAIDPPKSYTSFGAAVSFLNELEIGEKIPPFIVEIDGIIEKTDLRDYNWIGDPVITVSFPSKVTDLGLRPASWQDKYIFNPLKGMINNALGVFNIFMPKGEVADYLLKDNNIDTTKINTEIEGIKNGSVIQNNTSNYKSEIDNNEARPVNTKEQQEIKTLEKELSKEIPNCSKTLQPIPDKKIIINEVAWMGSHASASDEWIELKNISEMDINLKDWRLTNSDNGIDIIFENKVIYKNELFLLERTDDEAVPFKQADIIYKGAISNGDDGLYLFDNNCQLQDVVLAVVDPGWPAGDSKNKKTMERASDLTWQTYSGSGNNNIFGTPKDENSKPELSIINDANKSNSVKTISPQSSINTVPSGSGGSYISYCSQNGLSAPNHNKIIINEVAWMGSHASASDEWIELKNISETTVNLNGWQLLDKDDQVKILFDSGDIINPNSFYLLERTNDDSVPNITADKIYTGAVSNTDESLRLFNSECHLEDEVVADSDWPAGETSSKKTMERSHDLSWHAYSLSNADSTSGLYGTPKADNSITTNNEQEDLPIAINQLVISEVNLGNEIGYEYVEIFNQSGDVINFCPNNDNCYYLAYFSSNSDWNDPNHGWKFQLDSSVDPNSYYLIDIYGNSSGDWLVNNNDDQPYQKEQFNNSSGALALFSNNPAYSGEAVKTNEETIEYAKSLKVDAVGWRSDEIEPKIKEDESFLILEDNKVLARKWSDFKYTDTDNNSSDFNLEDASPRMHTPQPPHAIDDLAATNNPDQRNSVVLSWTIPEDEDSQPEDIRYDVYYSKNVAIDEINLTNIDQYIDFNIENNGDNGKRVILPDLYYDSTYYFTVMAIDVDDNKSLLSNRVEYHIDVAIHQKESTFYDYTGSNKSKFNGPTSETIFTAFAKPITDNIDNSSFSASPAIDENGTVYIKAKIDFVDALYAYDKNGNLKWQYNCPMADYEAPSLGKDGTIYFYAMYKLYALSPSGKVKWSHDFNRVYSNIIIDSQKRIYFIAEDYNGRELVSIEETINGPVKNVLYRLENSLHGENSIYSSQLLLDAQDNIYFSINSTIIKYKFEQGVIAEKYFPINYCDTCDKSASLFSRINQINISKDNIILFNLSGGGYNSEGLQYDIFYAVDGNSYDILWSKDNYADLIGINDLQFYFRRNIPTVYWYAAELCAADIYTGEILWEKRWGGQSPAQPQSIITVDDRGNIYFVQGSDVFGYNPYNISEDTDPEHDRIFSTLGIGYYLTSPIAIGEKTMYIPGVRALMRANIDN